MEIDDKYFPTPSTDGAMLSYFMVVAVIDNKRG
jgi:glycyl-tRNA synthetase beta subunit